MGGLIPHLGPVGLVGILLPLPSEVLSYTHWATGTQSTGSRERGVISVQVGHRSVRELCPVSTAQNAQPLCPLSPQIDLQKMPLGKLSRRQIQAAYSILSEVQQVSKHLRVCSQASVSPGERQ